jgi:chromosome segregation ATPase
MASPEKQHRFAQLREDMDGAFEVLTATNNTVKAIAATQQQHGRHLTKLQASVDLTASRLGEANDRLDTLEINQIRTNDTLREHGTILQEHGTILQEHRTILQEHGTILQEHSGRFDQLDTKVDTILTLLQRDRPSS